MIEIEVYTINGEEYLLLDKKTIDNNIYYYLSNKNKENDFMLRKEDKADSNYFVPLDSEDEVKKVLTVFAKEQLDD